MIILHNHIKSFMEIVWKENFSIMVKSEINEVVILANKEGLESLAKIISDMAKCTVHGVHIHLDQYNSLNDGSIDLVIEKMD